MKGKVLILDENHSVLEERLVAMGFICDHDYASSYEAVMSKIDSYDGLIIRSRVPMDKAILEHAKRLKFIGRVGAGMENIDLEAAASLGITCYSAGEGNKDAVAEHALGMLLMLFNKLNWVDREVRKGIWKREENRGLELKGKTVGILGYGKMGTAFAQRLQGFEVSVIAYDILTDLGDANAKQVDLETFFKETDVLSIHLPLTDETKGLVNLSYLRSFQKSIYLINTARGACLPLKDLHLAIQEKTVLGACLDVLEVESKSFENWAQHAPDYVEELLKMQQVVFSPHIAGWTVESKYKLAKIIADKIESDFGNG